MTETSSTPDTDLVPVVSQEIMSRFAQMAVGIPEARPDDAYDDILSQLLNATNLDDLNAPWDTAKTEDLVGYRLRIDSIQRFESDYTQGLGLYLVCKGQNTMTGEKFVVSTGSISVVAQLAQAWYLNMFPVLAEFVVSERPTKSGYRPQHLKIHAAGYAK